MVLFLQTSIVRRPICPTFIHDDPTRILVSVVGILVCSYLIYRTMRHFGA